MKTAAFKAAVLFLSRLLSFSVPPPLLLSVFLYNFLPNDLLTFLETGMILTGAPGESRTHNLLIRSQMLYPLSYGRELWFRVSLFVGGLNIQSCRKLIHIA